MKRLTWVVGPPAAGKSTWARALQSRPPGPRVLELAHMLHPLVDPARPRRGMMRAKALLIQAIRQVELDPANDGLPPLVVVVSLIDEDVLRPLSPGEDLVLVLPPREQWERQFLARSPEAEPGSRSMTLEEARSWYERYCRWTSGRAP